MSTTVGSQELSEEKFLEKFRLGQELYRLLKEENRQAAEKFVHAHYEELLDSAKDVAEREFPDLFFFEEDLQNSSFQQGGPGGVQHPPPDAITHSLGAQKLGSHNEVGSLCEPGLSQPAISVSDIGPLISQILSDALHIKISFKNFKVRVSKNTYKKLFEVCKKDGSRDVDMNDFFLKLFKSVLASKVSENFSGKKLIQPHELVSVGMMKYNAGKLAEYPEKIGEQAKRRKEFAAKKNYKEAQTCLTNVSKLYGDYKSSVQSLLESGRTLVNSLRKRYPAKGGSTDTDAAGYEPKEKGISLRFPEKDRADLEKICNANGYSMSHFLSVFLEEALSGAAEFTGAKLIDDRPIKQVQDVINSVVNVVYKPKKIWNYLRVNTADWSAEEAVAAKKFAYETKEKLQGLIKDLRAILNDVKESV